MGPTVQKANAGERAAALKRRTRELAVQVVRLSRRLPGSLEGRHFSEQLVHSATSVAANYRAVCRARSGREFLSKLSIVIEECDETLFWLEVIAELELIASPEVAPLMVEANEVLAIMVAARKTLQASMGERATVNRQSGIVNRQSAE